MGATAFRNANLNIGFVRQFLRAFLIEFRKYL